MEFSIGRDRVVPVATVMQVPDAAFRKEQFGMMFEFQPLCRLRRKHMSSGWIPLVGISDRIDSPTSTSLVNFAVV